MKITKSSTLAEIIRNKGASEILAKNGVPCISCPMASFEMDKIRIGQICKIYRLNLIKILKDLNKINKIK